MRSVFVVEDGARVVEVLLGEYTDQRYGAQLRAQYEDTPAGRASARKAAADLTTSQDAIKRYEQLRLWNPFRVRPKERLTA